MEGKLTWVVSAFLSDICVCGDTRVLFNIHCLCKKELLTIMTLLGKASRIYPCVEQQDSRSEG